MSGTVNRAPEPSVVRFDQALLAAAVAAVATATLLAGPDAALATTDTTFDAPLDTVIRRAEQYQPVIQLRAGTRVSVVFLEGARLDGGLLADQRNTGEGE